MSKNKKISMYEVARIAGVSPSTVSRALKDHHTISQATKQKINDILNGLKNNTILDTKKEASLKLCFYTESWSIDVLYKAMHNKIIKTNHEIIFEDNSDGNLDIAAFKAHNFDGIIFLGYPKKLLEIMPNFNDIPAIQILGNENIDDVSYINVTYNSYLVAAIMINYLKQFGQHIYYINTSRNHSINVSRRESLINYQGKLNNCEITTFNYQDNLFGKDIEDFVDTLPKNGNKLLFACYDDEVLSNVYFWLSRHGLKYEQDYMIIGCNKVEIMTKKQTKLPTIDLHFEQIGEIAIDEMIKKINDKTNLNYTLALDPELIIN